MAESAGRGAALDWKTSLQELTAALGLGVPDYVIDDAGPDHAKTFTAWVVVAGERYGGSDGRSKKQAEQRAAAAAWRTLTERAEAADRRRRPSPAADIWHEPSTVSDGGAGADRRRSGTKAGGWRGRRAPRSASWRSPGSASCSCWSGWTRPPTTASAARTAAGLGRRLVPAGRDGRLPARLHVRRRRRSSQANELAFFPLYPMLIRLRRRARPGRRAPPRSRSAGSPRSAPRSPCTCSAPASTARRAGWALVAICCSAPMSVVLSMAYSESLFLALVAGMLVAAHRRVWWAAGLLGLGAALTRPTGAAAAVALAVAAALAVRDARETAPAVRGSRSPPPLVALAGVPAYLGWVGLRVGDLGRLVPDPDGRLGHVVRLRRRAPSTFLDTTLSSGDGWVPMSVALILLAALAAAGVALAGRPWLPLAVYGLIAMVLVYGQAGFYHSKPRLLLPVLLTLLPGVRGRGPRPPPGRGAVDHRWARVRALVRRLPGRRLALHDLTRPSKDQPCPSFPRSRPSGRAWPSGWPAGRIDTVEVHHPRAIRRHLPGDAHFAAMLTGRTVLDVARRGKYLWLPLDSGDAIIGHLGMSGQLLMQPAEAPDEPHLRVRFTFTDGGPQLRFVDQRTFGGLSVSEGGADAAGRDRAHRPRPDGPALRRRGVRGRAARQAHRGQAGPARPDADLRGRQHLRRRGAVAGPAARRPADRRADQAGGTPSARPRPRRARARPSWPAAPASTRCTST